MRRYSIRNSMDQRRFRLIHWSHLCHGARARVVSKAVFAGAILIAALAASRTTQAVDKVDFIRDIRPILSNHCFQCHGPDAETREAELRLDQRVDATKLRDSGAAIVPEKPDSSLLMNRVASADPATQMPPPEFGKPLSKQQLATLSQWIAQGAEYAEHWAFQPIRRPPPPALKEPMRANHPVDAFIRRKLATLGLSPSPEAAKPTLVRRVHLDVLGLPPSMQEVAAFVDDERPGAYERMLDRALASPRFGERWGRHWLDQARYADSHGYTNDNERSIWPYRDWVIGAFNRDLPFDQFTIEQLAGDMLPDPTLSQRVATGFHRNTLINSEGGTKTDQFRDEQVKDRVDTTGLVWMGMTVGCAKCHAHKFDPLSQREYYQLYAVFNSTTDANSVTPTVDVPSAMQDRRLEALGSRKSQLADRLANDEGREQRQREWELSLPSQAAAEEAAASEFAWTIVDPSGKSLQGSALRVKADKSLLVEGAPKEKEEYHVTIRSPITTVRSVRLETIIDPALPHQGPGRSSDGNFVLSEFWFRTGDGRELRFSEAYAEHSQDGREIELAVDGKQATGWSIGEPPEGSLNQSRAAWFVLPKPLEIELDHALTFKLQFHDKDMSLSLGRFRISLSEDAWVDRPSPRQLAPLAKIPMKERSKSQRLKLEKAFLAQDPVLGPVQRELAQLTEEHDKLQRSLPTTMILSELDKPRQAHVQIRGEFLRTAEPVEPDTPEVLPVWSSSDSPEIISVPPESPSPSQPGQQRSSGSSQRLDRLEFARWLMRNDHPLTARVRVNRIWMRLFGRGIVETENDFGIQGTSPSHPDLLDWLAAEFQEGGWSSKRLLRTIMTSDTYRQSSRQRGELAENDPQNLWLGRQSRLRVEAEIVRDIALSVSGQLGTMIGGPSVHPPQPAGVYAFTQRKKSWPDESGESRFRRGMYTFFYRSAPYPMLTTFDTPKFNATCTRRSRSNTPLQSLTIANSEAMFELAQQLGRRVAAAVAGDDPASEERRLQFLYQLCCSRKIDDEELSILRGYLEQTRTRFDSEEDVWTALARVVMNLDEFITRE